MLKFEIVEYEGSKGKKHHVKRWSYSPCDMEEYFPNPESHHEEWHLLNDKDYNNFIVVADPRTSEHKMSIKPLGPERVWGPKLEKMGINPADPVVNGTVSCHEWLSKYVVDNKNRA